MVMSERQATFILFKSLLCWTMDDAFRQTCILTNNHFTREGAGLVLATPCSLTSALTCELSFPDFRLYIYFVDSFIASFSLWDAISVGAGTCLFAWPPALHPASALCSAQSWDQ